MADDLWALLEQSRLAVTLRGSLWLYPIVNTAHLVGIALLVGAVAALDLRLLGAFRRAPLEPLARVLVPLAGFGLVLAVTAGVLLFLPKASDYAAHPLFRWKLVLIALALMNGVLLTRSRAWRAAVAGEAAPDRGLAIIGGASLVSRPPVTSAV